MRQLATSEKQLLSYDATALIIGPGTPLEASKLSERLKVPYPVLADEDGQTYAAYGLRKVMFNTILQSATVVIDREGVIRYVRRSTNPGGAFQKESVLVALQMMSSIC